MTEIIEGTAVEVEPVRALVVDQGMAATGPLALAGLSDDEFDRRLGALDTMRKRVARMQKALMVVDVDYGVIPGTGSKPTLLKPGAEKLCQAYGLAADFLPIRTVGDGVSVPHLSYVTRCELHLGSLDGLTIAVGYGAANSWERKHRYRRGERVCPECGKAAIIKGKAEYGGGWVCFKKKDGCGAKWRDGAPEIEGQSAGDVENPDPFDLDVVLAKMSEKRAFIDATLRATAASGLFTQDIEDITRHEEQERPVAPRGIVETREHPVESVRTHDGGLIGTASVGKGDADFEMRQSPDGMVLVFRLVQGRQGIKVVSHGPLAEAIATLRSSIEGTRVTVWGTITDETFTPKGTDRPITYQVMTLERIQTPDMTLPAPEVEAPPEDAHLFGENEVAGAA